MRAESECCIDNAPFKRQKVLELILGDKTCKKLVGFQPKYAAYAWHNFRTQNHCL
jgi:hypothetical protein